MGATSIEWCDHSINPIRARDTRTGAVGHYCEKIAPGCANCYASRLQSRFKMPAFGKRQETLPEGIEVFLDTTKLDEVYSRKKPTIYFWEDMSDLFGWWVTDGMIMRCLITVAQTPWHWHIWLTKRPERMAEFFAKWRDLSGESDEPQLVRGPEKTRKSHPSGRGQLFAAYLDEMGEPPPGCAFPTFDWMEGVRWWGNYFPNLILMTSISKQADADTNIPELLKCREVVPVLGVSAEPLLGPVDLGLSVATCNCCDRWPSRWIRLPSPVIGDFPIGHTTCADAGVYRAESNPHGALSVTATNGKLLGIKPDECEFLGGLDWVIVGGESGPNARPCRPEWIRSIVTQCQSSGVPVFVKQMGANIITRNDMVEDEFNSRYNGWPDPAVEWDIHGFRENYQGADCRIRTIEKKGGNWNEWPEGLRVRQFPKAFALAPDC